MTHTHRARTHAHTRARARTHAPSSSALPSFAPSPAPLPSSAKTCRKSSNASPAAARARCVWQVKSTPRRPSLMLSCCRARDPSPACFLQSPLLRLPPPPPASPAPPAAAFRLLITGTAPRPSAGWASRAPSVKCATAVLRRCSAAAPLPPSSLRRLPRSLFVATVGRRSLDSHGWTLQTPLDWRLASRVRVCAVAYARDDHFDSCHASLATGRLRRARAPRRAALARESGSRRRVGGRRYGSLARELFDGSGRGSPASVLHAYIRVPHAGEVGNP